MTHRPTRPSFSPRWPLFLTVVAAVALALACTDETAETGPTLGEPCEQDGAVEGPYECRDGVWSPADQTDAGTDVGTWDAGEGCDAESDDEFCERYDAECGMVTETDNCGETRTVDCGGCAGDEGWQDDGEAYECCDEGSLCTTCQDQQHLEPVCEDNSCSLEVTGERTLTSDCQDCPTPDDPYGCTGCDGAECSVDDYCEPNRVLEVLNGSNQTLHDYQVDYHFDTAALIEDGEMAEDCSGLRVYHPEQQKLLEHWIAEGCDTESTELWIRMPELPPKHVVEVYLFWGDDDRDSAQDPEATMDFWENFADGDYDGWSVDGDTNDSGGHYDPAIDDENYVTGGYSMSVDMDGNCHSSPYDGTDFWMEREVELTDFHTWAVDVSSHVAEAGQYSYCVSDDGGHTVDYIDLLADGQKVTGGHTCTYDEACELCTAEDWDRNVGIFDSGTFPLRFHVRTGDCKVGIFNFDQIFVRKHHDPEPIVEAADE